LRVVCEDSDSMCTIPTKKVPESHSSGERLKRLKRSAVNSGLPKRMVSPGVRLMSVELPPSTMKECFDEVTIKTYKGKARYKSPYLTCQLSVFFILIRYKVVKIACSSFAVVF
jgi:hypothetical protein